MQIEAGKYYKTRDGRVVGPMTFNTAYDGWRGVGANVINHPNTPQKYNLDGTVYQMRKGEEMDELVSVAYPETGTMQEIGAKVGDVVEWDGHISHTVHDIQNGKYHISETNDQSGYKFWWSVSPRDKNWRIITRAPETKPSPVREVTRKEIVPGTYGKVNVSGTRKVWVNDMRTAADLTAAIATLTEIRDAMVQE